jgi:hypothetical protein
MDEAIMRIRYIYLRCNPWGRRFGNVREISIRALG